MSNSFKLCPPHFFKGAKKILVWASPPSYGLIKANTFSFSEMLWKEHTCDRLGKSCTTVEWARWRHRM